MKFSTRTFYGLKAVLMLAIRYGEGSFSVSQIAKKEAISVAYLEQILNALKRKGIVKSVRGPQGGYVLNVKPSDLTLEKLLYGFEEKSFKPLETKAAASKADADESALAEAMFWRRFLSSLKEGLGSVTLKDLIDDARKARKSRSGAASPNFHI